MAVTRARLYHHHRQNQGHGGCTLGLAAVHAERDAQDAELEELRFRKKQKLDRLALLRGS